MHKSTLCSNIYVKTGDKPVFAFIIIKNSL
mgnify:CR=1 FL=1